MKHVFKMAAVAALALTLFVGCSYPEDQNDGGSSSASGGGGKSSGSGGVVVSCNINDYRTVEIGDQVWMAENLNCAVSGSKCYDNDPANCTKYGRLYNWATAMALPDSCNRTTSCTSQISTKHRGICPSGWHLPSSAEWDRLLRYVDGNTGRTSPYGGYDSYTAGKYLKATSGWNWDSWHDISGNGTDDYGFSGLPGGNYDYHFLNIGESGIWWSASESEGYSIFANIRSMTYSYNDVSSSRGDKDYDFSVRCVQD